MTGQTILIVEDDRALQLGLQDNFALRGAQVLSATDGLAGLQTARKHKPDLILLDIMMPKMDGFAVCHQLRLEGHEMPIIMLTAKGEEEDIVRGLNCGADDYVIKPFRIKELVARVNAFLRRLSGRAKSETVRFGDCELNFSSHILTRAGAEVPLMPKEYGLLAYFLRHPGPPSPATPSSKKSGAATSSSPTVASTAASPPCARRSKTSRRHLACSRPFATSATASTPSKSLNETYPGCAAMAASMS